MGRDEEMKKLDILSEVKSDLLKMMKRRGRITAKEGAEEMGLAQSTIRQHLLGLENDGFVDCADHRQGVGRPQKIYFLIERGEALFPRREMEVFPKLLEFLLERGYREDLEYFFSSIMGARYHETAKNEVWGKTPAERLERLEEHVKKGGYAPQFSEIEEGQTALLFHHCPFEAIADFTEIPCECERRSMEELLDAEVEQETSMARGDSSCRFVIRWKE